jgi:hypothetical protein
MNARVLVGSLLLAMCGVMLIFFVVFFSQYTLGWNIARLVLVASLAFFGTQVLFGKSLPGARIHKS